MPSKRKGRKARKSKRRLKNVNTSNMANEITQRVVAQQQSNLSQESQCGKTWSRKRGKLNVSKKVNKEINSLQRSAASNGASETMGLGDDEPSTSTAIRDELMFQKFRNESKLKGVQGKRKFKKCNTVTKKLLKSIQRRQMNATAWKQQVSLRRKLNLSRKQKTQLKNVSTATAKETCGREIKNISVDDDDDCVLIEQPIEHIVIDDDQPSLVDLTMAFNLDKDPKDGHQVNAAHLVTSTPLHKTKDPSVETPPVGLPQKSPEGTEDNTLVPAPPEERNQSEVEEKEEGELTENPLFYVDTKGTPWFESVNSTDPFTSTTRNSRCRRSNMFNRGVGDATECCLGMENSDVIVVLDDTPVNGTTNNNEHRTCELEDSVIFVSESNANEPGFIPFKSTDGHNCKAWHEVAKLPPRRKPRPNRPKNSLFTSREERELSAYNNNAYNPAAGTELLSRKRLVLIDGSNVAFNHALNQAFSVKGLQISIEYFQNMGHEVKAVVPQFRLQRSKSTDSETLEKLHREGKIVFTPCKQLPGKQATSYDDRFILQLACTLDAAIVSNDNYRDLVHENAAFKKIIENRVIGYTWCNDIFILPKDPYGRIGPHLHDILNRC